MKMTERQLEHLTRELTDYDDVRHALKIIIEPLETTAELHDYLTDVLEVETLSEYLGRISDNLGCIRKEKLQRDIKEWRQDLEDWIKHKNELSPEERLIQAVFGPPPKEEEPE